MKTEYKKAIEKYKHIILEQKKVVVILVIAVFTIASLLSLVFVPPWRVAQFGINDSVKIAELENSYRATIAQIFGGLAIIIGLYYTWQRITIAENNLKVAENNLKVAQEGQITERFTQAINQLGAIDQSGKPAVEIRLGGIYALERIANESKKDFWPIMEILTAYIRKNSPIDLEDVPTENIRSIFIMDKNNFIPPHIQKLRKRTGVSFDIQSVMTVIGRRNNSSFNDMMLNCLPLDLRDTYLQNVNLWGSDFKRANFGGANLVGAALGWANLEYAFLGDANLEEADLERANLKGAYFGGADLKAAKLTSVNFEGAVLKGAKNLTIEQITNVKTLYNAKLDEELRRQLKKTRPDLFMEPYEEG